MSREVMQQALDALGSGNDDRKLAAIFALEAELAKPAPVAVPDALSLPPLYADEPPASEREIGRVDGWNACREAMLTAEPGAPVQTVVARHIQQLSPVAVPEGWQLVPKEPIEAMVIAGFESEPDEFFSPELWQQMQEMSGCRQSAFKARLCWAAMLAAAPQPPPSVDVEAVRAIAYLARDEGWAEAIDMLEQLVEQCDARAIGDET